MRLRLLAWLRPRPRPVAVATVDPDVERRVRLVEEMWRRQQQAIALIEEELRALTLADHHRGHS